MTHVAHVVSSIDDPSAGTTYAVTRLCQTLGHRGLEVELHTLAPLRDEPVTAYSQIAHTSWGFPARLGISPPMRRALLASAQAADVVHNHGVWMMPNIYAGYAARRAGRPFVFSVHGMFAPWAMKRSRWKKALVGLLGQSASLDCVSCFHATAPAECQEIRQLGYSQPVAVVPFGIDVPAAREFCAGDFRTLLFLSRMHPKKGVDVLLQAWRRVQAQFPDWRLVICGPDNEGYLPRMMKLADSLDVERVDFVGPKYGEDKEKLLDSCELFVLPTFNENFGFVVAEALVRGKPAIVTQSAPWGGLRQYGCGWWIDTGPGALEACLRTALARDAATLAAMGQRGRKWMIRDFSWPRVGEMFDVTYQWLLGQSARPDWIHTD